MKIEEIRARTILNSREEKTIEVLVKSKEGVFSSSAPSGKSKGKHEKASFRESIESDINVLQNTKIDFKIEEFEDLEKIEKIVKNKIGANSLFALETAILKALAAGQGKELWEIINEKAKKMPYPVGNCIGGGLHSKSLNFLKPDFQEFLIIPKKDIVEAVLLMNRGWELCGKKLKLKKAVGKLNDENAWSTSLTNEECLEILDGVREELEKEFGGEVDIGLDVAASSFYNGWVYNYKNPQKKLSSEEQLEYIRDLIKRYRIGYVEDPFYEESFSDFSKLIKDAEGCLIVGDDLTVSNVKRLEKAIIKGSINGIIVKPNQNGSLLEIKKLIEVAKEEGIATIMSHRSGETLDHAIADLAFGFQTDFVKFGVKGKEREIKLNRLINIEKKL